MKKTIAFMLFGVLGYLLFWPVPIDPLAWKPMRAPILDTKYAKRTRLVEIEKLMVEAVVGPEDVAIGPMGQIYAGGVDGAIVQARSDGADPRIYANTGGRPLGLDFDPHGNLIVADAVKGLLSVTPDGVVTVLVVGEGGQKFGFLNDIDVDDDGLIYFSDASYKHGPDQIMEEIMEHRPYGRLLVYEPSTQSVRRLLGDLYFANGVAVSPDKAFVLVVETTAYRIRRYWLNGDRKGQSEIFIDNLPGFPDGISSNGSEIYWLAIYEPRNSVLDALMPRPFLRRVVMRLPDLFMQRRRRFGIVLGLSRLGNVTYSLQDPSGIYAPITSVEQHGRELYLGSRLMHAVGRIPVP